MDGYSYLSSEKQRMIDRWFMSLPKAEFLYLVATTKEIISKQFLQIKGTGKANRCQLRPFLLLLKILHTVNNKTNVITSDGFYVDVIAKEVNADDEIAIWHANKKHKANTFTFIDYPWVLTCGFKSKVLEFEIHKEREVFLMSAYFSGISLEFIIEGAESLFFNKIHVRRDNLIEDTLNQLTNPKMNFKKNLKVNKYPFYNSWAHIYFVW